MKIQFIGGPYDGSVMDFPGFGAVVADTMRRSTWMPQVPPEGVDLTHWKPTMRYRYVLTPFRVGTISGENPPSETGPGVFYRFDVSARVEAAP